MSTVTKTDPVAKIVKALKRDTKDYDGTLDGQEAHYKRAELLEACHELVDLAKANEREFTTAENQAFRDAKNCAELLSMEMDAIGYKWTPRSGGSLQSADPPRQGSSNPSAPQPIGVDTDGREFYALTNKQKLADLPTDAGRPSVEGVSLGRMLCAKITGNWRHAQRERQYLAALSEDSDSGGGILVPIELGRQLIDKARAASAVLSAGAVTVPMTSDRLIMARVASDPAFAVVGENVSITEDNPTFDSIGFTAHKIAGLVKMSRELVADAPNMSQAIEDVLAKAFAAELDRLALVGSGSNEPEGLELISGIGSTGSVGAIAWSDVHGAVTAVRALNHEPTGYVLHPTIAGDLDILTSGDGTNSAALWQGPPPSLDDISRHVTTNATTALCFVGDWSRFALGIRQDPLIELTTEGGDAFEKHQVLIKLTWRGDFNTLDATAFHMLSGITT